MLRNSSLSNTGLAGFKQARSSERANSKDMKTDRRKFLQRLSALSAAAAVPAVFAEHPMQMVPQSNVPLLNTSSLARFVSPLPIPGIIKPAGTRPDPTHPSSKVPYYRVSMRQFQARLHRDMPATTLWGYNGTCPGPTFDVRSGQPILVEWSNELPIRHLFSIDHMLHGAEAGTPDVRTIVHLHGGRTPPDSDGYPEDWFVPGKSGTTYYPNQQEATSLFYHDHAMAITRLNTVAGLTGMYLIRDQVEDALPLPRDAYEIPLTLFDRSFHPDGQLYYPVSAKPNSPWVSEYYGSAILANGAIFPYLEVEPRKYRFRMVNSSNGSFYKLSLGTEPSVATPGVEFHQIGSDQGLLGAPVAMDSFIFGPADRADLIVDFTSHANKQLYFRTESAVFMQIRVGAAAKSPDESSLPKTLRPLSRMPETAASKTRELTIADYQNRQGDSSIMLLNGAHWDMPVTESPILNSTEIWSFINLTDDSHPIHLHMVRFQILDRHPFDLTIYQLTKKIVYTDPPVPLAPGEMGWKDTVRVDPLTITRIIVKFEGFAGRYVWHCHMLEHEDNEMMRPYDIVPA